MFSSRNSKLLSKHIIFCAVIFLTVAAVFFPALNSTPDIVSDDMVYIGQWARLDFTIENILFYLKHPVLYLFSPLVMYSFMVDKLLWTDNYITGIHITNAVLHAISAVLLFNLLNMLHFYRKGKHSLRIPALLSAAATLLWALHPQRAESVAWASERKDVLITLFFLGAALSFVKSFRKNKFDITGSLLLALSFLCKPMLITFPALAAVFIFCETRGRNLRKKVKFIIPSAAVCLLYLAANATQMGKSAAQNHLGDPAMLLNTAANVGRYFAKTFYPLDLCTWYPIILPYTDALYLLIPALPLLLLRGRWKNFSLYCLLPCVVMFGIAISPVSGIVPIGATGFADRYSYIPSVFLTVGTAFIAAAAMEKWKHLTKIFYFFTALILLFFCIETRLNCGLYRDKKDFHENALAVKNPHHRMLYSYGHVLLSEKRFDEAVQLADSIQILPRTPADVAAQTVTYRKTVKALVKIYRGNTDTGLKELDEVLFSKESASLKHYSSNFALDTLKMAAQLHLRKGNISYAAHIFGMLSDFYGEYDPAERDFYLGVRAMIRREHADAERFFTRALQARPDDKRILANLQAARAKQGKM